MKVFTVADMMEGAYKPKKAERIQSYVDSTRWYNGGAGLIVHKELAKELKDMGVTEGYTIQQPLPRN